MKLSLKYIILPFTAICVVITWILMPYILDALSGKGTHVPSTGRDNSSIPRATTTLHNTGYSREFIYPREDIRDPFVQVSVTEAIPQTISSANKPGITLTGIIWDSDDPVAIIQDSRNESHIVRKGEEIDGIQIMIINSRSIIIRNDNITQELMLWSEKL